MTKRLIFLDFDGVLNRLDPYGYLGVDREEGGIESNLVKRVAALAEATDAKIVLSTAWREVHSLEFLRGLLERKGLPRARVIGKTPTLNGTRGDEIAAYLRRVGPAQAVVIDDNDSGGFSMNGVRPWLVRTNPRHGLTLKDVERATALLTTGPVWAEAEVAA